MGSLQPAQKPTRGRTGGKVNAHLAEKLQAVKWGEFRIGDLFEKLQVKTAKKSEVRKFRNNEFNTPVVYCKFGDNGIMYWGRENEFTTFKNTISVIYNGAIAAGKVYAQKESTGILAESYLIRLKNYDVNHSVNLFIAMCLEKVLYHKYSREYLATWDNKVENDVFRLPTTATGEIDFVFMEDFIAELEASRIAELEAYLIATGLSSYQLTENEKEIIEFFATDSLSNIAFKTFSLQKLFGKSTRGKRLKSLDRISGSLPFVTAGETDTGISAFIGNDVEIFKANTTTIDMFGSAKYRNYDYGADDHVAVVHTEKLNKHAAIFVTTAIHKASYTGEFHYGRNFYAKDADELNIQLPTTTDGQPDYDTMQTLISAVQKLVIKDVVDYTERKMQAYRHIVQ